MKRMLFNATQPEESRVAIVDGQKLINLDIETFGREQRKGNIYRGVITKVEPSLEACFVDYGADRHGFLPFKEIHRSYYKNYEGGRAKIQEVVHEGDRLLVQVQKDERGNKGAALTTYISLAGRYLVVMPNNPRGGGVSRRIEGEERAEIKNVISHLDIPKGMSVIARTAGIGRSAEELQWDLDYQLKLWDAVLEASRQENVRSLILQESALVIRAIRDHFQPDIGEILIDNQEVYDKVYQFISFVMPQNLAKVKFYQEHIPLFSRFQIENQIDTVYARHVSLPSGGEIVIDHTEALVSIDVNSAKATKGSDVEETALRTNLEAAEEISRQMRLRDIGGLVVIDFIDMEDQKHQREVEAAIRNHLKEDRARVQTTKLSRFGLMEISRQRLQVSLGESTHMTCPRCYGTGVIRGVQSSAIHILRVIQEKAMKENTGEVQAQLPIDVATFLLNEKREHIFGLEERLGVPIIIIPNKSLEIPHYSIERIRVDEVVDGVASYSMVKELEQNVYVSNGQKNKDNEQAQAVVQGIHPSTPAPKQGKKSLLAGFTDWLSRLFESEEEDRKITEVDKNSSRGYNREANHRYHGHQQASKKHNHIGDDDSKLKKNTSESKKTPVKKSSQRQSKSSGGNSDTVKNMPQVDEKPKGKPYSDKLVTSEFKVKKHKDNTKDKPVIVNLSEHNDIRQASSDDVRLHNNKNIRKNTVRKNNRQRVPSASYLQNRINVDRLARYIQRTTVNVLRNDSLVSSIIEEKKTLFQEVETQPKSMVLEPALLGQSSADNLHIDHVREVTRQDMTNNFSERSGLILVETSQDLLEERARIDNAKALYPCSEVRRNDVELIGQSEEIPIVMQQVETRVTSK